ncbi:MAG: malto-oligosyltrehalose synthase [Nitrospira sp. WS110]|nr:malto-oligosyltrehalose synthase [Nitrospira sp. WS110]
MMPRIPVATYRIQLNRTFRFQHATQLVPYLNELGITDLYCSPYFRAVPGSMHGYDVVDPTTLNPEIGTEDDYRAMIDELHRRGMGHLLDVVPNHMGVTQQINAWWQDVLENGPGSRYASFFDIDWDPLKLELRNKVLLPILGNQYGVVLEDQELQIEYQDGRYIIRYYDHRLPVAPKASVRILSHRLKELVEAEGPESPHVMELESIITALTRLPPRDARDPAAVVERYREKEVVRRRLSALLESNATIRSFLDENVRQINGIKGDPHSFDLLDDLLNDQAYRLADWRVAAEEINYRRFFDINELAALRMENPEVFEATHQLVFRLLKEGAVTGLRIDHVDGLYDPADYLQKLQAWVRREWPEVGESESRPLYLLVEKILGTNERIPETWTVHGTTGYEFLALVNGLFVNRANERAVDAAYTRFVDTEEPFEELAYRCKQLIMNVAMASELNVLGHQLNRLSERDRRSQDYTLNSLTHAIREIIACFPVYRTYITGAPEGILDRDRAFIWQAVTRAKRRNPALSGSVFDFVRDLLLQPADAHKAHDEERLRFVMKFQQTTSPVTAKGIEDTAFYRYYRLVSLNEVGADPQHFGVTPTMAHQQLKERQGRWPATLSTTATHDTKRGEDVRMRIAVLSEMPRLWSQRVTQWSKSNRKWKVSGEPGLMPTSNDEYLLYQTLLGAWPLTQLDEQQHEEFCARIQNYMNKAIREAKVHTSWINPDHEYEEAMRQFVAGVLNRSDAKDFLDDFLPFRRRIAQYGIYNSLAQLLIKITAPGVPDFYQGTEFWDLNLVDPDNRRPVDYGMRQTVLASLRSAGESAQARQALLHDLLTHRADGRIKLWLTTEGLRYRQAHAGLFQQGEYVPLQLFGPKREHLFAFARIHGDQAVVVVVPRLLTGVIEDPAALPVGEKVWGDTRVMMPSWKEGSPFRNALTGSQLVTMSDDGRQTIAAAEILKDCPVALVERMG